MNVYNVLNGDSLKEKLPKTITGEQIICRECFVDGNVKGSDFKELYKNRAVFINSYFLDKIIGREEYKRVSDEFDKIQKIPENAEINLWFEEDLFCQVNLWFILHLIKTNEKKYKLNLVLPSTECKYSFNDMPTEALIESFKNRVEISLEEFEKLSMFWKLFQNSNYSKALELAYELGQKFHFLIPAIKAWNENRPKGTLQQILQENKFNDFWDIFNEFKRREAIYGFGDLQVKRLLKEINAEN